MTSEYVPMIVVPKKINAYWLQQMTNVRAFAPVNPQMLEENEATTKQVYGLGGYEGLLTDAEAIPLTFKNDVDANYHAIQINSPTSLYISDSNGLITLPEPSGSEDMIDVFLASDSSSGNEGVLFDDIEKAIRFTTKFTTVAEFFTSEDYQKSFTYLLINRQLKETFDNELIEFKGTIGLLHPDHLIDLRMEYYSLYPDSCKSERLYAPTENNRKAEKKDQWMALAFPASVSLEKIKLNFPKTWAAHCKLIMGIPVKTETVKEKMQTTKAPEIENSSFQTTALSRFSFISGWLGKDNRSNYRNQGSATPAEKTPLIPK